MGFGILGTILEKLSGQRFDVYIRKNVLQPIGVNASFNLWDIEDINTLAVLYRNSLP